MKITQNLVEDHGNITFFFWIRLKMLTTQIPKRAKERANISTFCLVVSHEYYVGDIIISKFSFSSEFGQELDGKRLFEEVLSLKIS